MRAADKTTLSRRPHAAVGPLANRVALVTGGSRGIGRAIAERLAREGAYVFVNFRRASRQAAICVKGIRQSGGAAEAVCADITSPGSVARMFDLIARRMGRLDILIGNAGIAPIVRQLDHVTPDIWNVTFATNVAGAFFCAQRAIPLLRRSKEGRIVFIGSAAARLGGTIGPHYAASKAALVGLVEYLSRAVGRHGITVNLVEPGFVATDLSAKQHRTPAQRRAMRDAVPLRRIGTAEDVAAAVAFLTSSGASYVTRQRVAVSGGR
jgi:3-oxoacyl-[acyl-carrier protein] reductase